MEPFEGMPVQCAEFKIQRLCDRPRVYSVPDFLTSEECDYLIGLSSPRLKPSLTISPKDGSYRPEDYRSSSAAFFYFYEDPKITEIEERIARLTGIPVVHGEMLQVLHYDVSQEYVTHYDFFSPDREGGRHHLALTGQRIITVLLYLNQVEGGGETIFPKLGLKIIPRRGQAIMFYNILADGSPDLMSCHAGLKVERGEKWLATKWLHDRVCPILDEHNNPLPFYQTKMPNTTVFIQQSVPQLLY